MLLSFTNIQSYHSIPRVSIFFSLTSSCMRLILSYSLSLTQGAKMRKKCKFLCVKIKSPNQHMIFIAIFFHFLPTMHHRCFKLLISSCNKISREMTSSTIFFSVQAGRNVRDLFEDLRDGHNLLSLLEVLSGEILVSIIF